MEIENSLAHCLLSSVICVPSATHPVIRNLTVTPTHPAHVITRDASLNKVKEMFLKRYLEHRMLPYSPWQLGGCILIGRCLGPLRPPGFQEVGGPVRRMKVPDGRQVFWLT